MADRYGDEWKAGLLDPERRFVGIGVADFLEEAGLRAGMTMVDYGCGPGFVTLRAGEMVGPAGRVYALDIHQGMVALAGSRAAEAGLTNVTTLLNDGPEAPLPDGVADFVTCIFVLHYRESRPERGALAADLARLLKPGGRLVVLQWADRMSGEETVELLTAAGLECSGPYPAIDNQCRVTAVRPLADHRAVPRPVGLGKGLAQLSETFCEPLPDEALDDFEGAVG